MITEQENNPDLLDKELYEKALYAEIDVVRSDISKIIEENQKPDNKIYIMAKSGSKGEQVNTGQMSGCIGMIAVSGSIIPKRYNQRTMPYFFQNDDRGEARGLIKPSFILGMGYPQFFFLQQAARDGLIDSAVKTADSGYIQRKLIKTIEDAVVKYDCTVRGTNNGIIQFVYGDTGADTRYQHEYIMKMMELGNKELESRYKFTDSELKEFDFSKKENDEHIEYIKSIRDSIREIKIKCKMNYITISSSFNLPININRIINSVKNAEKNKSTKLEPKYVILQIENLLHNDNTQLMCIRNKNKKIKTIDEQINKSSFKYALFDALSPKVAIVNLKLSKEQFDDIITRISGDYNKNLVQPGEHVGILSAQAMGEPTTQMTLKSFHKAGIGAMADLLSGVPRVKELLSLIKKIKTPQMIVYLSDEYYKNKEMALKISSYIRYTTLGQIRNKIEVFYDPNPYRKDGIMDRDNVYSVYYAHNASKNSCQSDITNLPWLIRIELDREKMLEKEVTLLDIKSKFCNQWEKRHSDIKNVKKEEKYVLDKVIQCAILSNTDNDDIPVLHLRFDMIEIDYKLLNDFIDIMIDKFKLKGLPNIGERTKSFEERVIKFGNIGNENNDIVKDNQWVVYTQGINLYDIRYLTGIDINKTICNDVLQMYRTFGIEAARTSLIREIVNAYDTVPVNYNHLSVLIDSMTVNGFIQSVDRYGMSKGDNEPLSRVSFEKMVEQMIVASVFNEVDHMKGVSARIMGGLVVKGGTGMCNVVLDTELLEKSEFTEDMSDDYENRYREINKSNIVTDTLNNDNTGGEDIFMPM